MNDPIRAGFLKEQCREAIEMSAHSDLVQIHAVEGDPPDRYLARFRCKGLVRDSDGAIHEHDDFTFGIWFPEDYLRRVEARLVVAMAPPWNVWHPNVTYGAPFICPGHLVPGTCLRDIVHQIFDVLTYNKWAAHDPLNEAAAQFARTEKHRFPIDRRPFRRAAAAKIGGAA